MPASPPRRSTADALKESEARIRALTREIGSLREDLRREVKRRERAVTQAGQHEATCIAAQRQAQELDYANRKLAAELDAALDAARAASERDKRALRTLREGLTQVEQEVAARGKQGSEMAGGVLHTLHSLSRLLLEPPGVTILGTSMAQQTSMYVSQATQQLASIQELLAGKADGCAAAQNPPESPHAVASAAIKSAAAAVPSSAAAILHDVEKQQLQDEVTRLRVQLRSMVDKAAGAASAASLEVQALLRDSQAEAVALRAELTEAQAALQRSAQELSALQSQVSTLQARVAAQVTSEQAAAQAMEQLQSLKSTSDTQLSLLQANNQQLHQAHQQAIQENAALKTEASSLSRQLQDAQAKLHTLQCSISDNQQELQAAMQLLANKSTQPCAIALDTSVQQYRAGSQSVLLPRALPPQSPGCLAAVGDLQRMGDVGRHGDVAGLRSSWGFGSSSWGMPGPNAVLPPPSPPRPYSAGAYSLPSLGQGIGMGPSAYAHASHISSGHRPGSAGALQQVPHPAAFAAAATHLLHSSLDAPPAAVSHGHHSSLTLFPGSSPAVPPTTVPTSYTPHNHTSYVPLPALQPIPTQGPLSTEAQAHARDLSSAPARISTGGGFTSSLAPSHHLLPSLSVSIPPLGEQDRHMWAANASDGMDAPVTAGTAEPVSDNMKSDKVRRAAGAAAAAAAAAIAARLKAQKAVAAAATQDSRRTTEDSVPAYAAATGSARTLAMERLGARLRVADTISSVQDDPSSCSSTSRLSSSSGSITSIAAPRGVSKPALGSDVLRKSVATGRAANKQHGRTRGTTGQQQNMNKLMQDMHNLDAEIEALEVSMQCMRP